MFIQVTIPRPAAGRKATTMKIQVGDKFNYPTAEVVIEAIEMRNETGTGWEAWIIHEHHDLETGQYTTRDTPAIDFCQALERQDKITYG